MSEYKFKVGDRVRLVYNDIPTIPFGSIGTVLENSRVPWVSWDGFANGGNADGLVSVAIYEGHLEPATIAQPATSDRIAALKAALAALTYAEMMRVASDIEDFWDARGTLEDALSIYANEGNE